MNTQADIQNSPGPLCPFRSTNITAGPFPDLDTKRSSFSSLPPIVQRNSVVLAREASSRRSTGVGVSSLDATLPAPRETRSEPFNDGLYGVLVDAMISLFKMGCLDTLCSPLLTAFEELLAEHQMSPGNSRLRTLVPEIGVFFTPLPFAEAFHIYNKKYHITQRRFVPPSTHEIRHVMNIAQIVAVKNQLQLVSFDGDETLYPDGRNFESEETAFYIATLLKKGLFIAIVTAAGYGYQAEKYETRLVGLLEYFRRQKLASELLSNFFVFGGESNYLLRCGADYHLQPVPEEQWRSHVSERMQRFFRGDDGRGIESEVSRLLSTATQAIESVIQDLDLRAVIVRKERAVGLVPGGAEGRQKSPFGSGMTNLKPEILDETVFRIRDAVRALDPPLSLPYCAFNGGHDVWVDVGNKAEGLLVLQSFLGILPQQCIHIGDQFSTSGNDVAARDVAPTLWICNPSETRAVLRSLLRQMNHYDLNPTECVALAATDEEDDEIEEDCTRATTPLQQNF